MAASVTYIFENNRTFPTCPLALTHGRYKTPGVRLEEMCRFRCPERVRLAVLVLQTLCLKGNPDALGKGAGKEDEKIHQLVTGICQHRVALGSSHQKQAA